ncbi:S41 family peptidase [Galbibacter sp. PAP.153]|uniref:S41 family peptidase n=1 Tax=Galbibacter sp. PAP.153 TaxID=3104623 RepID=UPI003009D479
MKRLLKFQWVLLCALFINFACTDRDDNPVDPPVDGEYEIQDFIWKSMNYWYYWQEDVNDLADDRFATDEEYTNFLSNYTDPEDLFNNLVYTEEDDFSWYIEDVDEQANEFRGISESYGISLAYIVRISQDSNDVVAFVGYVIPNSPASDAGIKRGDLIYKVDGTKLTVNNYQLLNNLFTEKSISLGFGEFENGAFTGNANDTDLTAVLLNENPVHYHSVIEENGKKIGYLVYNSFINTYHKELNDVFAEFKAANIDELVLDLRYNGGGSVLTAAFLASMIDGTTTTEDVFAELEFNAKRNEKEGGTYPFFDKAFIYDKTTGEYAGEDEDIQINRLTTLNRLYVIGSGYTASASEMIINGLRPFMDVILVGETTVGKNEGSITVYDSGVNYTDSENRNPNHNVGLQPIVFQIFNSEKENNYDNGFEPDITIEEAPYAANILPFGDPNEIMLRTTLDAISGASAKSSLSRKGTLPAVAKIKGKKFSTEMYIAPGDEKFLK